MFTDLFWFDAPRYYFNRPVKDMQPHYEIEKDGKLYVALNALGVAKEDVSVNVKDHPDFQNRQIVEITGKTHNELLDKDYNFRMSYILKDLAGIEWDAKDGILVMEITFKEPVKSNVLVVRK